MNSWNFTSLLRLFFIMGLGLFFASCIGNTDEEIVEVEYEEVEDTGPTEFTDYGPIESSLVGACHSDTYLIDSDNEEKELDILIVPYPSLGSQGALNRFARDFDGLLSALPDNIHTRIGVITGYGSTSSQSGRLYSRNSSDPLVLDSHLHSNDDIRQSLQRKLNRTGIEMILEGLLGSSSGFSSLHKALTSELETIKSQGLLREGAGLHIIFISPQSDTCAQYPEGAITRFSQLRDTAYSVRYNAFQRDCVNDQGEHFLTHDYLADLIKSIKPNDPVSSSALVYSNPLTMPQSPFVEYGYGYLELTRKLGGQVQDFSSSDYFNGLFRMGTVAASSVDPQTEFNLPFSNVYAPTIEVFVDGELVPHMYVPELNQVHISSIHDPFLEREVRYCERISTQRENIYLEAGANFNCVIHRDGSVRCWGQNNRGQLGQGHTDNLGSDERPLSEIPPLVFEKRATMLAGGGFHMCALFENAKVKCWGGNDRGQLGLGDTIDRGGDYPATELDYLDFSEDVLSISAGTFHTCAILESGNVVCWGDNSQGQLGAGHTERMGDTETVGQIPPLNFGQGVIRLDISSISNHSCAILENREMVCWGSNMHGQLGLGNNINRGDNSDVSQIESVQVDAFALPVYITSGNFNTCALLDNQDMKCWGTNNYGQLGIPGVSSVGINELPIDSPRVNFGDSILGIASANFSTCAIGATHDVKCWGGNNAGQAGVIGPVTVGEDQEVSELEYINLGPFRADKVVGGAIHHCALTVDEGQVICWGSNTFGQLGRSTTNSLPGLPLVFGEPE